MDSVLKKDRVDRNSSIELLRIISIVGVIILHYNVPDTGGALKYVEQGSINQRYLYFTEGLFICAVDLFIMISAYFMTDTKIRKPIKVIQLIIQVIIFRLIRYIVGICTGNDFSIMYLFKCFLPVDYFVILYSILYLISPYYNILIERLNEKQFTKLVVLLFFIFSIWSISVDVLNKFEDVNAMSSTGIDGSQGGYTIVNFVLLYFIGSYIKRQNITFSHKKKIILFICLLGVILATSSITSLAWNYNNPFVIMLAAIVLIIFKDFDYSNRIINEFASGVFTCYLFHNFFMKHLGIEYYVSCKLSILIIHQFGTAIALYLASYIVHKIYHLISDRFIRLIEPLVNKIDLYSFD